MTSNKFASLNLLGKSPSFLQAVRLVERYSACDAPVLILGETGTGKELAARAIHYLSSRTDRPFIPVNCGAITDSLLESEFFGHIKGAFTDARESKQGLIAQAKGGTIFLDEVEAMTQRAQVTLLRFLQDQEYRPVGGSTIRDADVRIVAASNTDLVQMVLDGELRADLLFRLNVLSVHLPPLRNRAGDVRLLSEEFVDRLNHQSGKPAKALHPKSFDLLEGHHWPGNIRELQNLIHREFLLAEERLIEIRGLAKPSGNFSPPNFHGVQAQPRENSARDADEPPAQEYGGRDRRHQDRRKGSRANHAGAGALLIRDCFADTEPLSYEGLKKAKERVVAELELYHLKALMTEAKGNVSQAARLSGRDRSDLCKLLRRYELDRTHFFDDRDRATGLEAEIVNLTQSIRPY